MSRPMSMLAPAAVLLLLCLDGVARPALAAPPAAPALRGGKAAAAVEGAGGEEGASAGATTSWRGAPSSTTEAAATTSVAPAATTTTTTGTRTTTTPTSTSTTVTTSTPTTTTRTTTAATTSTITTTPPPLFTNGKLYEPSDAPLRTFYMYRAVSDKSYPPDNVNTGSLAGVLWYLHNEVVHKTPRKFGISRIVRYKVQTRATQPLFDKGMNFGVRFAFDAGQCTGPFECERNGSRFELCAGPSTGKYSGGTYASKAGAFEFGEYGYFVGCNKLGRSAAPRVQVMWAKRYGIKVRPYWYPGLTRKSSFQDFQNFFFKQKKGHCTRPPCKK